MGERFEPLKSLNRKSEPDSRVFIGVDGGGTKTSLCAYRFDAQDRAVCVSSAVGGGMNYHTVGVARAAAHLLEGVTALGLTDAPAAVGIGDPSCDVDAVGPDGQAFLAAVRGALGCPVVLKSDAYVTLRALTDGREPGVLTISGTGAMTIGEDAAHGLYVAGGWGQLTGDEGSGYYIGLSGIKAALRCADGIAPDTSLLPALCRRYGADPSQPRALIDLLYDEAHAADTAAFAADVAACADAGDAEAGRILRRAALYLADYTTVVLKRTDARLVGVYGSVLMKNRTVRGEFERILRERFPDVRVTEPERPPEEAAARMAREDIKK